jgi:hypothetical protein
MVDKDIRRLVAIFQEEFNLGYVEPDPVKYVKRYPSAIRSTGQLFKYFGLAKGDKQSPLGWRPTRLLLDIMNEREARSSKPTDEPISMPDELLMRLMHDAIFGADANTDCTLGYEVLLVLGLTREGSAGGSLPTPRLLRFFEDGYYKHLISRSAHQSK